MNVVEEGGELLLACEFLDHLTRNLAVSVFNYL